MIEITIKAANHAEYKNALAILAAGLGAGDMNVESTTVALKGAKSKKAVEPEEDEEQDEKPVKKTRVRKIAAVEPEEDEDDTTEDEEEDETPAPPKKKASKAINLEDIRTVAHEKNKTHKDEVKKLVKSYGVATFSEISPDKLPDFLAKLQKIGSKKKAAPAEEDDDFLS